MLQAADLAAQRLAMVEEELRRLANPQAAADMANAGVEVERFRRKMEELRDNILKDFPTLSASSSYTPPATAVIEALKSLQSPTEPVQQQTAQPPHPGPVTPPGPPYASNQPQPSLSPAPAPGPPGVTSPPVPPPTATFSGHPALTPGQVPAFQYTPPQAIPIGPPPPPPPTPPPQPLAPPPPGGAMDLLATAARNLLQLPRMFGSLLKGAGSMAYGKYTAAERELAPTSQRVMGTASMAAGMAGGIGALVSAADPFGTFPTLLGSLKMLSIEIGSNFLPIINQVSGKIQELSRWIDGLDPILKKSAATWVTYAAGAGLGAIALFKLWGAAKMAVGAVAGLFSLLLAHPVGAVITVGSLAAAYLILKNNIGGVADKLRELVGLKGVPGGEAKAPAKAESFVSAEEVKQLPPSIQAKIAAAGGDKAKITEVLKTYGAETKAELEKQKAEALPALTKAAQAEKRALQLAPSYAAEAEQKYASIAKESGAQKLVAPIMRKLGLSVDDKERIPNILKSVEDPTSRLVEKLKSEGLDASVPQVRALLSSMLAKSVAGDASLLKPIQGGGPATAISDQEAQTRNTKMRYLEEQSKLSESIMNKTGKDMLTSFRGPEPAILETGIQLADRIQMAGLRGGDLDQKNMADQLKNFAANNGKLLTDIYGGIKDLAERFR